MTSSYGAIRVQLRKSSKNRPAPCSAAALDRPLAGRGQVLLDALRQPGDLRVVEQAAHDAGAVAAEGRGDGRQVAGHGASASAPRA